MGKNFDEVLEEALQDPVFRAEWEALEPLRFQGFLRAKKGAMRPHFHKMYTNVQISALPPVEVKGGMNDAK